MRRYRLLETRFDTRAVLLGTTIPDDWDEVVKTQWQDNKTCLRESLQLQLGTADLDRKERDFIEHGPAPWTVNYDGVAELREIRDTFAAGDYQVAAGAAGAAAEHFLNMLVKDLRDRMPATSARLGRGWTTKWRPLITALFEWHLFSDGVAAKADRLASIRHQALHRGVIGDPREVAMEAHHLLRTIVESVLGGHLPTPWFIECHPSEPLIAAAQEQHPVVQTYYLPRSAYVGPWHQLEFDQRLDGICVTVLYDHPYEDRKVSDAEYIALRR